MTHMLQMIFSRVFLWQKMSLFWFIFRWSLSRSEVQLTHICSGSSLVPNRWQVTTWTNDDWVHNDVIKWKHFPRYWPFVWGIHRSPVNSTHKGQWRGALMFSLICAWINGWVNNREAGDLRCNRAHYDVTVMSLKLPGTKRGNGNVHMFASSICSRCLTISFIICQRYNFILFHVGIALGWRRHDWTGKLMTFCQRTMVSTTALYKSLQPKALKTW